MSEPAGTGATLLRVTIFLIILSWLTVISRLSVRYWLKPEARGLDDLLMCIGLVSVHAEINHNELIFNTDGYHG